MNYEEMSDFEINKWVWRLTNSSETMYVDSVAMRVFRDIAERYDFDPCNNPSDAWSIIVENEITICPDVYIGGWYGRKDIDSGMDGDSIHVTKDTNPLRAAMICFLKMKEAENG